MDSSACGTKKASCKNKLDSEGVVTATNAGENAFERHQIAVEEARHQITARVHLDCCSIFIHQYNFVCMTA